MDKHKKNKEEKNLESTLNDFLNEKETKECEGEECLINDGKEIIERVDKIYKTTDGRQLLM
tara:strand:+ start:7928 stop:8110 length:183 start_codon:yes stop_codon:yes gene_type:complete